MSGPRSGATAAAHGVDTRRSAALPAMVGVRDLAEWLGINRSTVHRLHNRGELPPAYKLGGVYRWRRHEIEEWLEKNRVHRGPPPGRRKARLRGRRPRSG